MSLSTAPILIVTHPVETLADDYFIKVDLGFETLEAASQFFRTLPDIKSPNKRLMDHMVELLAEPQQMVKLVKDLTQQQVEPKAYCFMRNKKDKWKRSTIFDGIPGLVVSRRRAAFNTNG
jgi:hypothetical protein